MSAIKWTMNTPGDQLTVAETDRVIVRYRDGSKSKVRIAGELRWRHEGLPDDIMEYVFSHEGPNGQETRNETTAENSEGPQEEIRQAPVDHEGSRRPVSEGGDWGSNFMCLGTVLYVRGEEP